MKFTPFQKYTIYTNLPVADARQRLKQSLAYRSKWFRVGYDGEIEADEFTIFQVTSMGAPIWPDITGRFSVVDRKTAIDVSIKLPRLAFTLGGTALAFLLACFATMLWSTWSETHSISAIGVGVLFMTVSLFLGYSITCIRIAIVTNRSKKFLRQLLEAE